MSSFLHRISLLALLGAACAAGEEPLAPPLPAEDQTAVAAPATRAPVTAPSTAPAQVHVDAESQVPAHDASSPAPPDDADSGSPSPNKSTCPDGYPRGTASPGAHKRFAVNPSPEGVTVCPDGHLFLSLDDGRIVRLSSDEQQLEPWTELPGLQPAGITCDEHNHLFVAVYGVRSGSGAPGVVRVDDAESPAIQLPAPSEASPLAAYNGILAVAGQGVYVTDSGAGWIVRFREASPGNYVSEIVARNIPIANGLAYDRVQRKLYVASSLDFAVYAFELADEGTLSERSKVMTTSASFFDGLAVDEHGTVYVADYAAGTIIRLSDDRVIAMLPTPASLAFRGGTLFVTDYRLNQPAAEGGLYSIQLGVCGG